MQAFASSSGRNPNIAVGLRSKSVRWSGPPETGRNEALQERLQELLVFELRKDGGADFLHLSVRGLYKHVLGAITNRVTIREDLREERRHLPKPPLTNSQQTIIEDAELGEAQATTATTADAPPPPAPLSSSEEGGSLRAQHQRRVSFQSSTRSPRATVRRIVDTTSKEGAEVTYRERLGGYLHPRDMRRLVTPFSTSNEPELIVRRHVMLLNFDPLRAIVLRDRLLVLVPDGADSLLVDLERRVRGGSAAVEDSVFGGPSESEQQGDLGSSAHSSDDFSSGKEATKKTKRSLLSKLIHKGGNALKLSQHGLSSETAAAEKKSIASNTISELTDEAESETDLDDDDDDDDDEWNEMARREWIHLPFELQCADAVLASVCAILTDDTYELQEAAQRYIQRLLYQNGGMNDDPLTIIRAVKDAVREMCSRVKGFVQSINRVLDEDEDMALMNLSRLLTNPERFIQPVSPEVLEEESDEPELILEAHLQTALTLTNALDLIQGQIDTAAELVDQKLDAARNRILFANMVISILSLCVSSASLVGSIFGMNLDNKLEDDPNAFVQVTSGTLAGATVLCLCILVVLYYSGTIPRTAFQAGGGTDV